MHDVDETKEPLEARGYLDDFLRQWNALVLLIYSSLSQRILNLYNKQFPRGQTLHSITICPNERNIFFRLGIGSHILISIPHIFLFHTLFAFSPLWLHTHKYMYIIDHIYSCWKYATMWKMLHFSSLWAHSAEKA